MTVDKRIWIAYRNLKYKIHVDVCLLVKEQTKLTILFHIFHSHRGRSTWNKLEQRICNSQLFKIPQFHFNHLVRCPSAQESQNPDGGHRNLSGPPAQDSPRPVLRPPRVLRVRWRQRKRGHVLRGRRWPPGVPHRPREVHAGGNRGVGSRMRTEERSGGLHERPDVQELDRWGDAQGGIGGSRLMRVVLLPLERQSNSNVDFKTELMRWVLSYFMYMQR